jgi:hypothetical protein
MSEQKTLDLINEVAKKNPLYKEFTKVAPIIGEVIPTKAYSKERGIVDSERSLSFKKEAGDDVYSTLVKRFGIKSANLFASSYCEAISGDGKEERRMLTLHSSSLCALLHFYNPETLQIVLEDGVTMNVNESVFEYKNPVFLDKKGRTLGRPSNIDVVLYGAIKETAQNCVLYLESKYSEYMQDSKNSYSQGYEPIIKNYFGSLSSLKVINKGKTISLKIEDGRDHYYDGIKQMAAHIKGVTNEINGCHYEPQLHHGLINSYDDDAVYYFGEIAYEHQGEAFNQWEKDYGVLAGVYNRKEKDPDILEPRMVTSLITYQELTNEVERLNYYKLEPEIALFYNEETPTQFVGPFSFENGHIAFTREAISEAYKGDYIVKSDVDSSYLKTHPLTTKEDSLLGGDVSYDLNKHHFMVEMDKELMDNEKAKRAIIQTFGINHCHTIVIFRTK